MIQLLRWPALMFLSWLAFLFLFRSRLEGILDSLKAFIDGIVTAGPDVQVRFIQVTAWPVIVLILIAIFSCPLIKFLRRIRTIEGPGIKLEVIPPEEVKKLPTIPEEKIKPTQ